MRSVILAILAPAAIAFTASASAAVPAPQSGVRESAPVTIDVAYRHVRSTTVRGPRGGIHHSRTVVAGRRGIQAAHVCPQRRRVRGGGIYGPRRVYATRGVAVRRGRIYRTSPRLCNQRRPRAPRRVYRTSPHLCNQRGRVRRGGYIGPRRIYATRGVAVRRGGYIGPRRVYATRGVAVRRGGYIGPRRVYATRGALCAGAGISDLVASMQPEGSLCAGRVYSYPAASSHSHSASA